MNKKQAQIFYAAYFSESENLGRLIQLKNDCQLLIPVPYDHWHPQMTIEFDMFEILRMNLDIWKYENILCFYAYSSSVNTLDLIENYT